MEAVPEAESLKRQLFQALDALTPPHAILASNTSSIAITRLAAATQRPDRVVGLHFMNPVSERVGAGGPYMDLQHMWLHSGCVQACTAHAKLSVA